MLLLLLLVLASNWLAQLAVPLKLTVLQCVPFFAKIPELSKPSVCMRDPQRVQETLQSMMRAGSNTVQVLLTYRHLCLTTCMFTTTVFFFDSGDLGF